MDVDNRHEHALQLRNQALTAISRAQSRLIFESESRDIFDTLLADVLDITNSEYGFIAEILHDENGAPYIKCYVISNLAWDDETRALYASTLKDGLEFHSLETLFGGAALTGETIIINDYAAQRPANHLPHGHPILRTVLLLPCHRGGKLIGLIGLANRTPGYDKDIVDLLEPVSATFAQMLEAVRIAAARREIEHALRQSEENFKRAQAVAQTGSWHVDLRQGTVQWSDETHKIFDTAPESPLSYELFLERVHPQDRDFVNRAWSAFLNGAAYDIEHRVVLSGETRWVRERAELSFDAQGRPLVATGTSQDISERKRAELALRESESRYRQMFDANPSPMYVFDANTFEFLAVNDAATQHYGYTREEFLRMTAMDIRPPEDVANFTHAVRAAEVKRGVERHGVWRHLKRDGSLIYVEITAHIMQFGNRQAQVVLVHDITERRQAEIALHKEKERLQVTLASIADAVITTDLDARVEDINTAAELLTGWTKAQVTGHPLDEVLRLVRETSRSPIANPARLVIEQNRTISLDAPTLLLAANGCEYAVECSAAPIRDSAGRTLGAVLVFRDVTERQQMQGRLLWQASHDALTGLPNRALLSDRMQHALAHARRQGMQVAACFLDLDGFKPINDRYGHENGDQLLREVAHRLINAMRGADTAARLGGDEFALLLTDLAASEELESALDRILAAVAAPYMIDGDEISISASIGVTVFPSDDCDPDTLLRHADQAMYHAKQSGRNRYHLFDAEQDRQAQSRRMQSDRLRNALEQEELAVYFQPKVDLRTGAVIGAEALLRWHDPEHGVLLPDSFLPHVEHTEFMNALGTWILRTVLQQQRQWRSVGLELPVSVNVSARELLRADFVPRLKNLLDTFADVPPQCLELEVLESAALADLDQVRVLIGGCRDLGVSFALDDFGTGYSSLAYLKRLPANTLKIDRSFVRDILDDPEDRALVEGVVSLARVFKRNVIAEGVETVEHGVLLMRLGCDVVQGYATAPPMPADEIVPWLQRFRADARWRLWSDVEWTLEDLPLIVAQHEHRQLAERVASAVNGKGPGTATLDERFTRWYQGVGKQRYRSLPEFTGLAPLHTHFVMTAMELARSSNEADRERSRQRLPDFLATADELLENLARLERAVATRCAGGARH